MSPQECQIARCNPNQLEMMTNSPPLASEQCPIPDLTGRLAWLPLGNSRDSLRHPSQVYRNTNYSLGTRGMLHAFISSRRELISRILLEVGHIPTTPQEEPSLSNRYVRGTLNFLPPASGYRDSLTRKKVGFPCSGLNAGSSFIS